MALIYYFAAIVQDGDYLNDWLTHLPEIVRPLILFLGTLLATLLGS